MRKRILALVLALVMAFGPMANVAFANETTEVSLAEELKNAKDEAKAEVDGLNLPDKKDYYKDLIDSARSVGQVNSYLNEAKVAAGLELEEKSIEEIAAELEAAKKDAIAEVNELNLLEKDVGYYIRLIESANSIGKVEGHLNAARKLAEDGYTWVAVIREVKDGEVVREIKRESYTGELRDVSAKVQIFANKFTNAEKGNYIMKDSSSEEIDGVTYFYYDYEAVGSGVDKPGTGTITPKPDADKGTTDTKTDTDTTDTGKDTVKPDDQDTKDPVKSDDTITDKTDDKKTEVKETKTEPKKEEKQDKKAMPKTGLQEDLAVIGGAAILLAALVALRKRRIA